MGATLMMLGALLFPVVAFVLLLWLTHLEETLPAAVEAARREPTPPPVLAVPLRPQPVTEVFVLHEQRVPQRETSAGLSLGGSTNR